ncbi:MAG: sulfatase [Planctomycetaceae bacterium]
MRFHVHLSPLIFILIASSISAAERPNIVWISCEDISPQLGCYGDSTAMTPNLDKFAKESTLFTHAFSCHGVCAPSRTGIITGMYPISLGANHMRSKVILPDHVKLFPQYLKEAGYYCTNNSKTDYNLVWNQKAVWNESSGRAHWRNRPTRETPFFAVFNLTMTHESKVWPKGWIDVVKDLPESQRHKAEDMIVPPLYPDTPAVRADLARLADIITVMDQEVGTLLQELSEAGLAENTIVMFWSDHGNGLPRSKRWTYDSGSHVPLMVRVPEKLRDEIQAAPAGTKDDRMVSLIDLGPTVLSLAGIPLPAHMHGIPFLGKHSNEGRDYIYGARDRLDERFDMVRTVRSRTHRYVRNLMPWRPALQHVAYGEQNEILREMRKLLAAGELAPQSSQWFKSPRAAEELYDLEKDPWELVNLANDPAHKATLETLRAECDRWQVEVRDVHLLPEIMLDEAEREYGSRWKTFQGDEGKHRIQRLLEAAKQTSHLDPATATAASGQLDSDPAIRWWQLTLLSRAGNAEQFSGLLSSETRSSSSAIQLAAAAGLARADKSEDAAAVFKALIKSENTFVRHAAMLEIDEAGEQIINSLRDDITAGQDEEYVRRLYEHATKSE